MQKIALLLVLCGSVLAGCRGEPSRLPPIHLNQNMDLQDKYKAQRESKFFEDQRAARPPVEGAVGRDFVATNAKLSIDGLQSYDDRYLQEDPAYWRGQNADGSTVETIPASIKLDEAFVRRGQERFNIYCAPCHGQAGYGDGIVKTVADAKGIGTLVVPNFHDVTKRSLTPGHIFGVASNGFQTMKGYKHQISVEDRWAIVAYVRALQHSQFEQGK
jgi:mono/diheme cytochrome c family protein